MILWSKAGRHLKISKPTADNVSLLAIPSVYVGDFSISRLVAVEHQAKKPTHAEYTICLLPACCIHVGFFKGIFQASGRMQGSNHLRNNIKRFGIRLWKKRSGNTPCGCIYLLCFIRHCDFRLL